MHLARRPALRALPICVLALLTPLAATGGGPSCGAPASGKNAPVASDALFILGAAIGNQSCLLCVCDVNDSGDIGVTDALLDLGVAVGQPLTLDCPLCESTTTTSPDVTTTTLCPSEAPDVPPLKIVAVGQTAGAFATFAAQPPGSADWYLVEQEGRIRIIRDGKFLAKPFLDITGAIGTDLGERGLLGLAFHPDYAQNGRFFTMATPGKGADGSYAQTNSDAVVEWRRSTIDPDLADAAKARNIVVLPASEANHNGGTILFGPDGYLYVGTGDGGGGCESAKPGAVQDTTKLFGKILRLDVDADPPFAPSGHPFTADARVFHYGLRNPFRFGFDSRTSDLFIGDVGQNSYEEISVARAGTSGLNFGWPAFEGTAQGTCGPKPLAGPSPYTPPIVSIDRRPESTSPFRDYQAIVGGRVYRGESIPHLRGVYLFADFDGAELGALRYCDGQAFGPVAVPLSQIPASSGELANITSFVEGNDGEIYVTYGFATRIGRLAPQ